MAFIAELDGIPAACGMNARDRRVDEPADFNASRLARGGGGGGRAAARARARGGPLFVVGCGHSGTTELIYMLGKHRTCTPARARAPSASRVRVAAETATGLSPRRASLTPSLPPPKPARAALSTARPGRARARRCACFPDEHGFSVKPNSFGPILSVVPVLSRRDDARFARLARARAGALGVKSPSNVCPLGCIFKALPAARVVMLVRDGRDVMLSLRERPRREPRGPPCSGAG